MSLYCNITCLLTESNFTIFGIGLGITAIAFFIYSRSNSYKVRFLSLLTMLTTLPFSIVYITGTMVSGSCILCTENIIQMVYISIPIALGILSLLYYFFGSRLCVKAMKGTYMSREEYPKLYATLEKLCDEVGIETPRLAYIDSAEPLAMAISGTKNVIMLSIGTMDLLDDEELSAVLAHEIAHIKTRDSLTKFISKLFGVTYLYGFSLNKKVFAKQEKSANAIAQKVVGKAALSRAKKKFKSH